VICLEFLLDFSDLVFDEVLVLFFSLFFCQIDLRTQSASNVLVNVAVRADWVVSE